MAVAKTQQSEPAPPPTAAPGQRLRDGLRAAARWGRHLPDRLLHRRRHRQARLALARLGPVRSVLFLCYGNICRSPYAAAAFERLAGGRVEVGSAGLRGARRRSPADAVRCAADRGLDLGPHRSRLVTPQHVAEADLVIVMDLHQRRVMREQFGRHAGLVLLGDLDPERIVTRAVQDPIDRPGDVYARVYDRIDRCVTVLAASVAGRT